VETGESLIVIDHDGLNVGFTDGFGDHFMEFDDEDAFEIRDHWNKWLREE
jgi:hypothetical protein